MTALNSGKNLTDAYDCPNMDEAGRYWYNGGAEALDGSGTTAEGTAKAGSYLANDWGLYDMHGNVCEWCLDWKGTYPGTVTDPRGASTGPRRVVRGGSWKVSAGYCRSANRGSYWPDYGLNDIGFRAAVPPGSASAP